MANALAHRSVGILSGLTAAVLDEAPDEERSALTVAMGLGGFVGAAAPDHIEPALSPNHRATFHSVVALALACGAIHKLWYLHPETPEGRLLRAAALGFLVGYLSHLVMDATTPMSLPLI